MNTKTKNMIDLIKGYPLIFVSYLIGIILFLFKLYPFSFLIIFNAFDILGYYIAMNAEVGLQKNIQLPAYRIMQTSFQVVCLLLIGIVGGIIPVVLCLILHWFGWQDILFYAILKIPLPNAWNWLGWTPIGLISNVKFINNIFKIKHENDYIKNSTIIGQAIVGAILCLYIIIF